MARKTKNPIASLTQLANSFSSSIEKLSARHESVAERIALLKKLGTSNAVEFWKAGKYLYLNYPLKESGKDGRRRREYIGNDPAEVAAARESIARHKELVELQSEAADIERIIEAAGESMQNALDVLDGRRRSTRYW